MITLRTTYPDGSDSRLLNQFGEVSGWKHTIMYSGGCTSASFNFQASSQLDRAALNKGRWLYAYAGTALVWSGRLMSPQKGTPWQLTAVGNAAMAKDHINGTGTTLNTQLDAAIGNGLPWVRRTSMTGFNPAAPLGTSTLLSATSTLDDLLGLCVQQGTYWYVDPTGYFTMSAGGTPTRTLHLHTTDWPAQTQGNFATVVYGLYSTGQVTVTASAQQLARYGRIETTFDTGTTSSGAATTAATEELASLLAPSWSAPFTAYRGSLTTTGGVPVDLATVQPNFLMRAFVLQTGETFGVAPADIPIGQVDYDDDTGTLQLTPLSNALDSFKNVLVASFH